MSKRIFVFSTMSADVNYRGFAKTGGDVPVPERVVTIKGGAHVNDRFLVTPQGVSTPISEDDLSVLEGSRLFQKHLEGGYVKISHVDADPEKVAADMAGADNSAQLSDGDFTEAVEGKDAKPHTNGATDDLPPPPASRGRARA